VNFIPASILLGLILLAASVSLFLMGKFKPQLYRESDNAYALLGIICSVILIAQFSNLGLGMSFQQLIMIGALLVLMWENIQMRANNPAKRQSIPSDEDRPARRNYRADLEDPMPVEGRGSRDWQADGLRSNESQRGDRSLSYGDSSRRPARDNSRPSVRPARQSRYDNDAPVNPGEWGEPRSIPERSSRSPRDEERPSRAPRSNFDNSDFDRPMDRSSDSFGDDFGSGERVRPDRASDDANPDRPRRPRRRPVDDIPTVDYRPVDPIDLDAPSSEPKGSSWGPSN
jgi:Ycf66 protein N-terminus